MRRLASSAFAPTALRHPIIPCAFVAIMRSIKLRSVSKDDPFVENVALEDPELGASLSVLDKADLEELSKVLDTDQSLQTTHFGPQWARWSTLTRRASSQVTEGSSAAIKEMTSEEINDRKNEQQRRALDRNYQSYEEFFDKEIAAGAASTDKQAAAGGEGISSSAGLDSLREVSGIYDRGMQKLKKMESTADDVETVPSFMNEMMSDLSKKDVVGTGQDMETSVDARRGEPGAVGAADAQSSDDYPSDDPSKWGTEDVIRWLVEYAEDGSVDESMQDAFRMVKVDGSMLLNKVAPPELFKQMRRWHIKRQRLSSGAELPAEGKTAAETLRASVSVSQIMVQETIYLCYPYCYS